MNTSSESVSRGKFPLDNLTYDIVTILFEKSKGLEAYDKYIKDAQGNQQVLDILNQIRQQDTQHISQLKQCLGQLIGSGSTVGTGSSSR